MRGRKTFLQDALGGNEICGLIDIEKWIEGLGRPIGLRQRVTPQKAFHPAQIFLNKRMPQGKAHGHRPEREAPAVQRKAVHLLTGRSFVTPGPRLGAALRELSHLVHPETLAGRTR